MQAIKNRKLHHLDIRDVRMSNGRIVRIRERRSFDERYYPKLYTYEDVPIRKSK
jgi:hypothetical protein